MDITPIITSLLTTYWYFIPIAIGIGILKSPWFKGKVGEFIVNLSAKLFLDKKTYRLIKDVTLPTEDGTTQIDHVIVSIFGVFCVETKNMKGWIFGGENQKQWTQKIYKQNFKFQNPLHQNYKHVKVIQNLLGLDDNQIHSVVVFVGDSTFKTKMPENVRQGGGYIGYIKSKKDQVISESEVQNISEKIESGRLVQSFKTNRKHVKHLKTKNQTKKSSDYSCPNCGSKMILRTAKKGQNEGSQFWGCSRYPQCRGTVPRQFKVDSQPDLLRDSFSSS